MSSAEVHDMRPANDDVATIPHSIEAEQALLGCLLFDNGAFERIERLKPEDFFEPIHGALFAAIQEQIHKGKLAEPIGLVERLKIHPAFEEVGGLRYLADLVDRSPPAVGAGTFAEIISDLALKRELIRVSDETGFEMRRGAATGAEQLETVERQLFDLAERGSDRTTFSTFGSALEKSLAMTAEAYSRDGGLSGVATGLIDLDRKLGGLHPSDLIILASRPSMGKTSLATNIGYNVAKNYAYEVLPDQTRKTLSGGIVAFFSLEMSDEQLAARILAEVSGVPSDKMRKGLIDASEYGRIRDAATEIHSIPLHISDAGGTTVERMTSTARRLKRQCGLDLIIVDYLQLCGTAGRANYNRTNEVTEITTGLKGMAKALDVPVLALAQLSRQVEQRDDKRPQLADLRESGSIEQDADIVIFIFREAYYLARTEPKEGTVEHLQWQEEMDKCRNVAELIIGKQRHGPIGTIKVSFDEDLTKFGNLAKPTYYDGRSAYGRDD